MPKYGIHHIVLKEAVSQLYASGNSAAGAAADVIGHAYVNQIVGSPYRLNVHRHVTAENFQDSWKYSEYYGGESINRTLFARLGLPQNLPSDVGDLLFRAFKDAYDGVSHPTRLPGDGFYTRNQIDGTYEVFYEVLKLMGGLWVGRPEEPFSGMTNCSLRQI